LLNKKNIFDLHYREYDDWYVKNHYVYSSELLALKRVIPDSKNGIEIGIGTGRFARMLEVPFGIDISLPMLKIAKKRGCCVTLADAAKLPFKSNQFDFALLMVTLCFVKNPKSVIKEAKRILGKNGKLIIGIIDKNSKLGKLYRRKDSIFYKVARFFSPKEVVQILKKNGFYNIEIFQTLFKEPDKIKKIDKIKKGFGEGGFVVIAGIK